MNNGKNIRTRNSNGELHGYQEWYSDNKIYCRGDFKNHLFIGYFENHNYKVTKYYII